MLDHSLSKITLADCMKFLSDSMNKNVKPLVDGWGKFSLRNLLVDWNRRNQEMLSNVQHQGEAIISKGHEIIKDAHVKKEELIAAVQDKGEDLLAKKKQVLANVHHRGQELMGNIHNTGEHLIEGVLEGAKKKISVLTPDVLVHKKPHYDEGVDNSGLDAFGRRKRDAEPTEIVDAAAVVDPLVASDSPRFEELNEIDTKMSTEHDAAYQSSYVFNSHPKPVVAVPVATPVQEYFSLGELSQLFFKWVRTNLTNLPRLYLRRPSVTSA